MSKLLVLLSTILSLSLTAQARVILPSLFSDNMVLQQKAHSAVWGKSIPGKTIFISTTWSKKKYKALADSNGNWKIYLKTPSFGGPFQITISDGDAIVLKNILIGEVWMCSGQSNMEFPVSGWSQVNNYKQELEESNYPNIRLLQVEQVNSPIPLDDIKVREGGWLQCSPKNIAGFSAVAYFYAREIFKKTGMPIGLIHASWGGTPIEAWMSGNAIRHFPEFAKSLDRVKNFDINKSQEIFAREQEAWQYAYSTKDKGLEKGRPAWYAVNTDSIGWKPMILPTAWENDALPDFDGIVWYRKKITIPQRWAGKDMQVHLGTVDDNDITYFNGEKIGQTNGYDISRTYIIPAAKVKGGECILTVRVVDGSGGGGLNSKAEDIYLVSETGEKIPLAGMWDYKVGLDFKDFPMPQLNYGPNRPTVLFNAMIKPVTQFNIKGVIWYQGEANVVKAHQYRTLFPAIISDWRMAWQKKDLPFYYVQLANYLKKVDKPTSSAWAELRDAQLNTLSLPHTGMAVAIDIGEEGNVHPQNKQEVGRRLSLIALKKLYGRSEGCSGPIYEGFDLKNDVVSVHFKQSSGNELKIKGGTVLTGFTLAGADQIFHRASAVIKKNKIFVRSPFVKSPKSVRYGWADNPDCNLTNTTGLPASPFRSDKWEDSTQHRR